MKVVFESTFSMDESCTPQKTVDLIMESFKRFDEEMASKKVILLGVGVGTVGPLEREKGIVTNPVNFPALGWNNINIKDLLEASFRCPVFLDNGANTAVLCEYLFGAGKGFKNIAYFNCGVGIRTGAISSGIIVRTINDAEDAFAHMVVDIDGKPCICGNYGCIESYSSIHSIVIRFVSELKMGRTSSISKCFEDIKYTDICMAAQKGDNLTKEIITGAATVFGVGLSNYINLLNPGMVILSGPLIKYSELFYKVCVDTACKKCYLKNKNNISFIRGGYFEDNAIAAGAAAIVMENYLKSSILC